MKQAEYRVPPERVHSIAAVLADMADALRMMALELRQHADEELSE